MTGSIDLIRTGCLLFGLWGMLTALQWLAAVPRWANGGPLGWDLQRLRRGVPKRSLLVAAMMGPTGLALLASLLFAASLTLALLPLSLMTLLLLAVAGSAHLLLSLRGGGDGADKMALVVATGLFLQIAGVALDLPALTLAGFLWTGGQLALAYFAAGASKLMLAPWRDGTAVQGALGSYTFGHPVPARIARHGGVARALSWAIILAEIAFPLALAAPLPVMLAALAAMLLLHVAIALFMGLNTYPWAFLAAYPSAIMLHQWIAHLR